MNFIDTSRMYTTSENRIGKALRETDKKAVVATKSFNRSADGILKDVETSLKELQLDYIDLYQCHAVSGMEEYRKVTAPDGALFGLLKAKEQGIIGHIGITSHSLDLLEKVVDDGLFETSMVSLQSSHSRYDQREPGLGESVQEGIFLIPSSQPEKTNAKAQSRKKYKYIATLR